MQRRKFSRAFKIEAVRSMGERGVSVAQASRNIDVHENVVRKWVKEIWRGSEAEDPNYHVAFRRSVVRICPQKLWDPRRRKFFCYRRRGRFKAAHPLSHLAPSGLLLFEKACPMQIAYPKMQWPRHASDYSVDCSTAAFFIIIPRLACAKLYRVFHAIRSRPIWISSQKVPCRQFWVQDPPMVRVQRYRFPVRRLNSRF